MKVGPDVDVVCVVDLNEDVACLRGDLKKSFLEVVVGLVVVIIVSPRPAQVNVVPEACRHDYFLSI